MIGVGHKIKRKVKFFDEVLVFSCRIGTYANNLKTFFAQRIIVVAQIARFSGARWCIVMRIEIDDHLFTSIVFKFNFFSVLIMSK